MLFQLPENTQALLKTITSRSEKHGEEDAPATSYGFKITGPNTLLDLIDPSLRPSFYLRETGHEVIPGAIDGTPKLRCTSIGSVDLSASYEGWTLHVDHGIDESEPLTFGSCKVDKFSCTPMDGGTVDLHLRVGTSDVDAKRGGEMLMKVQQMVSIRLIAPEVVGEPTKKKSKKDKDATDLFVEAHST